MNQTPLFHESLGESLRTAVMSLGGFKRVGVMLWPELSADRAGRDLSDCLTTDNARKLTLEQVEFIVKAARRVGCHAVLAYLCESNDYEPPVTRDPETEVQRLQREYVEATRALVKLANRIDSKTADVQAMRRAA